MKKNKMFIAIILMALLMPNLIVKAESTNELEEGGFVEIGGTSQDKLLLYEKEAFVETKIHYVKGEVVDIIEREISEKEYNLPTQVQRADCSVAGQIDCWETNAKRITLGAWQEGSSTCPSYYIQVDNVWKNIPSVKSYDVIGIRFSTNFDVVGAVGYQYYNGTSIQYSPNGTNTKISNNGVGTSMNIADSASSGLHMNLKIQGRADTPGTVYFGGSYQHATSTTTLAQSQNYNFSSSGYGGVFAFASSVSGKYDAMQGVSGSFYSNGCLAK